MSCARAGAGDPARAILCARAGYTMTIAVITVCFGILLTFGRHQFAYMYTSSDAVAALSARVAWFFVLNQWLTGISVIVRTIGSCHSLPCSSND